MEDLAPEIFRKRLVVEGLYSIELDPDMLKEMLIELSKKLDMTIIYGPQVHNLAAAVNPLHAGFECNLIWAESGACVYTWNQYRFFTVDIYTCKEFDTSYTVEFFRNFFQASKIVYKEV
jgi:S-adenosylmethionine/arginine decarboxylase-like enzyme